MRLGCLPVKGLGEVGGQGAVGDSRPPAPFPPPASGRAPLGPRPGSLCAWTTWNTVGDKDAPRGDEGLRLFHRWDENDLFVGHREGTFRRERLTVW